MRILHQIPLARLTLPLLCGIAFGLYFPLSGPGALFYPIAVILLGLLIFLSAKGSAYSHWFGVAVTLFFVLLGVKLVEVNTVSSKPTYFENYLVEGENYVVVTIDEVPQPKAKTVKATAIILEVGRGKDWQPATGKLLLYIALDSNANKLGYGDRLLINSTINEIQAPLNPGQFDYKSYLEEKGIYRQTYLKAEDYCIVEHNAGNSFMGWVYGVRKVLLNQLQSSGLSGAELAVASALVLGYDDDIDSDLIQAYSASGTLHVLSVSGMHAGLVFAVLTWLLQWLGLSKTARITRATIIILAIWLYALVTGFSPPVIRAAAMFSLLAVGKSLYRYVNTYNILAGSCLLMLLYNPFLLADTGFQLSYLAVFGIAAKYPCLHRLGGIDERIQISTKKKPKIAVFFIKRINWVSDGVWSLIIMSVVAQLATLPLGLYYFHQFPNYFILANLVIIPLSTLALFGGIVLLLVSWIPVVASGLGLVLSKLIGALNGLVLYSEQLPYAITDNIRLSQAEVFLIGFIIIAAFVAIKYGRKQMAFAAITCAVVFISIRLVENKARLTQQKLVVYNVGKATAIEVITGNKSILIADSLAQPGTVNYRFNLKGATWFYGITNREVVGGNAGIMHCTAKTILVYNDSLSRARITKADYIIISKNMVPDFVLIAKLKPEVVILDATNKMSNVKEWGRELDRLGLKHYAVNQGAFVADL